MATVSLKLDKRSSHKDGKYPLKISVSQKGKTLYIPTNFSFTIEEWELVSTRLSGKPQRFNTTEKILHDLQVKIDAHLLAMRYEGRLTRKTTVYDVRKELLNVLFKDIDKASYNENLFLPYYSQVASTKPTEGTRKIYAFTEKLIRNFLSKEGIDPDTFTFSDVTPAWLLAFDNWMSATNGVNSRSKNMRNIRCVLNEALDDGKVFEYPFNRTSKRHRGVVNDGRHKFVILQEHRPRVYAALSLEQLITLRDFPCAPYQVRYRDMFMLMFYLIGINSVDLFTARKEQLINGRLEYVRTKTHRPYSIKVEPEAMEIINKYRGVKYLVDACDYYKRPQDFLHHMNDALKKIGITYITREKRIGEGLFQQLSSNWARHTWASIASNNGIPKDIIGKAMGHSWAEETVTDYYIRTDPQKIDEANRKVLDLLLKKSSDESSMSL